VSDPLGEVAELVEREAGIRTNEAQMGALEAALGRLAMDAPGFLAAADPARRPALFERLIDEVAIQETFFMREPRELEAIDWHRLLAGAHARGADRVRVWVSACASGEDAYSVAMLAVEAFGNTAPPVSVLATDISGRALRRASEALYSERSVREVGAVRRERFFDREGRLSRPREELRSIVSFQRHNLLSGSAQLAAEGAFDLILCRNVLIYFSADTVEAVVSSLESALLPGGQLILGASDRLTSSARRLEGVVAGPPEPPRRRRLRRPLGRAGREETERVLAADPLDAEAYYVRGLAELAEGDPGAAVTSHRCALYIDPTFALAAFQLGRAHDLRGDERAARRAYAQALRSLEEDDAPPANLLVGVGVGDIVAACRERLAEPPKDS
jgi:chemotaxis protein methyltransferase CheR